MTSISPQHYLIILGLLAVLLLSSGIGQTHLVRADMRVAEASPAFEADTLATMVRTACFGPCPYYELVIYADGRVVYEGHAEVEVTGIAKDTLAQKQLNELRQAFQDADYFKLRDAYTTAPPCDAVRTDFPTVRTSFSKNGVRKKVNHYRGCHGFPEREQLVTLENRIDQIINTERWTGVSRSDE